MFRRAPRSAERSVRDVMKRRSAARSWDPKTDTSRSNARISCASNAARVGVRRAIGFRDDAPRCARVNLPVTAEAATRGVVTHSITYGRPKYRSLPERNRPLVADRPIVLGYDIGVTGPLRPVGKAYMSAQYDPAAHWTAAEFLAQLQTQLGRPYSRTTITTWRSVGQGPRYVRPGFNVVFYLRGSAQRFIDARKAGALVVEATAAARAQEGAPVTFGTARLGHFTWGGEAPAAASSAPLAAPAEGGAL
jgi:hypothetical protein